MEVQIYTLSHPVTNEIRYVGRTIKKLSYRLYQHIYNCNKNNYHSANWIKAILKQGLKPKIELLDTCDESNWDILEQYWISQFKAWGFRLTNDCAGGRGNLSPSFDTRKKIAEATQKPIIQYSNEGSFITEYKSITEASKTTGVRQAQIIRFLRTSNVSARNYIWKYKQDEIPLFVEKTLNKHSLIVSQFSMEGKFLNKFDSIKIAGQNTGTVPSSISECCNGKLKSSNNFQWKFYELGDEKLIYNYKRLTTSRSVVQLNKALEVVEKYDSIKSASKNTGVDKNNISACCSGKLKSAGGYIWKYK